MERQTYLFVTLFLLLSTFLFGQNNPIIYEAYKKSDMKQWKKTTDSLEYHFLKTSTGKLELINYHYGYIAWCIDQDKIKEAKYYIKKAEVLIQKLEENRFGLSMIYAYKAAFVGFKIGISPYKAPFIGAQSSSFVEKSLSLDSSNALSHALLGNIAYYKPVVFGGSKKEAINHYLNAERIMEADRAVTLNNWNYLNLLGTIIQFYVETKQYIKAQDYCEKTLSIEPEFDWVKNKLYPQVLKGLKS